MNKTWVDIAVPSGPCEPSTLRPRRSVLGMDLHRIGAKPCPEGRDQDRGWSVSAGDVSPGQTRPMPSDCYACQQAGPEAPLRERFVRADGGRVAHDFNSSLESWVILAPPRHVRALDELTAEESLALGDMLRKASDRKSVREGKSVSEPVDRGGPLVIQKTKK